MKGARRSNAKLLSGLTLILHRFLGRLAPCMNPGNRFRVCVTGADVAAWPCSVSLLCKLVAFLGSLHWPADYGDMVHFGISYSEAVILLERWAGHRLLIEKVTRPHVRANRPISISSVPVSEGIEISQGCRFIASLVSVFGQVSWWDRWVITLLGG